MLHHKVESMCAYVFYLILSCWALWSLIVFDSDYNLTQNNVVIVFNKRFSENNEIPITPWT